MVEQGTYHQITGEPMKFLSPADWAGIVETELFAQTYKSYEPATVRYPVLEVTATLEPFEKGRGLSPRVLRRKVEISASNRSSNRHQFIQNQTHVRNLKKLSQSS
jgi:DNA polymerase III alpha subunit